MWAVESGQAEATSPFHYTKPTMLARLPFTGPIRIDHVGAVYRTDLLERAIKPLHIREYTSPSPLTCHLASNFSADSSRSRS